MKTPLMLLSIIACTGSLSACDNPKLSNAKFSSSSAISSSSNAAQSSASSPAPNTNTLVINEVVVKSEDTEFLDGNDWIEIYNAGASSLELSDYWIADSDSERYRLPAVTLNAGEYFVLAAVDVDDPAPPSPSVPFKLGAEDSLQLFKDEQLVTSMSWADGQIYEGAGFGLVDETPKSTVPTPAAANILSPVDTTPTGNSELIISEVVAKSADLNFLGGSDWIELYNSGANIISLSDYALADRTNSPIALSGQLNPGEYLVIAAVDIADANPPSPSVPFKFGSEDSALLYQGDELVDNMSWTAPEVLEGKGFGVVDGVQQSTEPTPNLPNKAAPIPENPMPQLGNIIINELVAKSDNTAYLEGNDWFELFNTGENAVELSDYYIADSGSELIQLPAGTLTPGAYIVITAADADDINPPAPSVPFKLGGQDALFLYVGENLISTVFWYEGEAPLGRSFGLFEGHMQTTTPTPGAANQE